MDRKELDDFFDIEKLLKDLNIPEPKYFVEYDITSGKILRLYPDAGEKIVNSLEVNSDLAESILTGEKSLSNFVIDTDTEPYTLVEVQTLIKIDDLLHRIVEEKWSDLKNPDIKVIYDKKEKFLTIKLLEKYLNGKINYHGSTDLYFYITKRNDPHFLFHTIKLQLNELLTTGYYKIKVDMIEDFSIFTRRLFKKYTMVIE